MGDTCSACQSGYSIEKDYETDGNSTIMRDIDDDYAGLKRNNDQSRLERHRKSGRKSAKLDAAGYAITAQHYGPTKELNVLHLTDFERGKGPGLYCVTFGFDEDIHPRKFPYKTTSVLCSLVDDMERVTFLQDLTIPADNTNLHVAVFRNDEHIGVAKFRPDHPMLKLQTVPWIAINGITGIEEIGVVEIQRTHISAQIGYLKVRCDVPAGSNYTNDISDDEDD